MSSRFLLLSGSAGPPTTLADAGRRHLLIDATKPRPPHAAVSASVQATIGRIMGQLGAEQLDPRAWTGLSTVSQLSALREMLDGLADPRFDRIVVECGSLDQARDLVQAPAVLARALDSALTPRLAMWRFAGEAETEPTVFEALSDARSDLIRTQRALHHEETVMRIVAGDVDDAQGCRDAASLFGVLGVASEVWLSGVRVMHVAPLAIDGDAVSQDGDEYRLELPLSGSAAVRARAGRLGDDLVVEFDAVYRWLPLPPVLLRCHAIDAERTGAGLSVRFAPDSAKWRQPAGGGA